MLSSLIALSLVGAGIIHLLPISGVLGRAQLSALYGLSFEDSDLEMLMRHRALLFGMLGALLVSAAFWPELRLIALIAGFISVVGFIALAWPAKAHNAKLRKVVLMDWFALGFLLVAASGMLLQGLQLSP